MTAWVCSSCGSNDVVVNGAHPSVDARYAVGHCERCTPVPKPPSDPRKDAPNRRVIPLVRADLFDPDKLRRDRKAASDRRLMARYRKDQRLSESDRQRVSALLQRYAREAEERRAAG